MLKQRIITAVILVVFILAALLAPNSIYWVMLINLAITFGFWEWLQFCKVNGLIQQVAAFSVFFAALFFAQTGWLPFEILVKSACLLWLALILFTFTEKLNFLHQPVLKLVIGVFVLVAAGLVVMRLRQLQYGQLWVLCFFICVWAADIGAYFVGRRFGKTKLAATISPGKTVEGLFGGIALALFIFVPIISLSFSLASGVLLLLTILITVLVSVTGDLYESKLKRYANLKDSSQILPGHGGILDRIDSLLAAAPFFAYGLMCLGYVV